MQKNDKNKVQENLIENSENLSSQDIVDEYITTYGGEYYGSIFGGYTDPPTPKLVISLVEDEKDSIYEDENTILKVTVEDAPEERGDISFCLGYSKTSSATYWDDYRVSLPYRHYDTSSKTLSDPVYTSPPSPHCSDCNPNEAYHAQLSKIPSDVNTVYYQLSAIFDDIDEPDEEAKIIIYVVHTTGYEKEGEVIVAIKNRKFCIDLDIDSDNSNTKYGGPNRDIVEDEIEDEIGTLGKIIPLNHSDIDYDGVIDCWDGYSIGNHNHKGINRSMPFVPIVIEIPGWLDLDKISIGLNYAGCVTPPPANMATPPTGTNDGAIRIWRKNGNIGRNGWDADVFNSEIGDHYPTGRYFSGQCFNFTKNSKQNWEVILYVEGIVQSKRLGRTIKATLTYNYLHGTKSASDEVRYVVSNDFIIYGRITYGSSKDPVRGAKVLIEDDGNIFDVDQATTYTNDTGEYYFTVPMSNKQNVNLIRVFSETKPAGIESDKNVKRAIAVVGPKTELTYYVYIYKYYSDGSDPDYANDKALRDSSGVIMKKDYNISNLTYDQKAFYVYDAMVTASRFHANLPGVYSQLITIGYPNPFNDNSVGHWALDWGIAQDILIGKDSYSDWDTCCHEYGHIVAQEADFFEVHLDHLDHYTTENVRVTQNCNCLDCIKLGFSEGWANYYSVVCQFEGYVPASKSSTPTTLQLFDGPSHPGFNIETKDTNLMGEDSEVAVARVLWDFYDRAGDKGIISSELHDNFAAGNTWVYSFCKDNNIRTVSSLWNTLAAIYSHDTLYLDNMKKLGQLFSAHGMGSEQTYIETIGNMNYTYSTSSPPSALPKIYWKVPYSGSLKLATKCIVCFLDENGNSVASSPLLTLGSASQTSPFLYWQISSSVMTSIITSGKQKIFWVVTLGANSSGTWTGPAYDTGMYWSNDYGAINIVP